MMKMPTFWAGVRRGAVAPPGEVVHLSIQASGPVQVWRWKEMAWLRLWAGQCPVGSAEPAGCGLTMLTPWFTSGHKLNQLVGGSV